MGAKIQKGLETERQKHLCDSRKKKSLSRATAPIKHNRNQLKMRKGNLQSLNFPETRTDANDGEGGRRKTQSETKRTEEDATK